MGLVSLFYIKRISQDLIILLDINLTACCVVKTSSVACSVQGVVAENYLIRNY